MDQIFQLLVSFIGGIFTGLLFSILAVISGKKLEVKINTPLEFKGGKASIIKKQSDIEEFIK